mmetsp:Transcript_3723/g.5464  ORF Transcript_3723/g.5464 Transcript_3723/m.5464 type:complete len:228 (-) Transcript_3723:78-761(-)
MKVSALHLLPFFLISWILSFASAEHEKCREWADAGECDNNPGYMHSECKKACDAQAKLAAELDKELTSIGSFYDLSAKDINGKTIDFGTFKGKVVIITNVASFCGYTESHYKGLVQLNKEMAGTETEILAFPCNQFGQQEPEECPVIKKFAQQKGVEFTMMDKIDVNGGNASIVYKYLKREADHGPITWNFATYFVVSPDGSIESYSGVEPMKLKGVAMALLNNDEL